MGWVSWRVGDASWEEQGDGWERRALDAGGCGAAAPSWGRSSRAPGSRRWEKLEDAMTGAGEGDRGRQLDALEVSTAAA